jgi:hypothetical protein
VVIAPGGGAACVVANIGPTLVLIFASVLSAQRSKVARSRVELFEQIRRDRRASGLSIRDWWRSIICTAGRCARRAGKRSADAEEDVSA